MGGKADWQMRMWRRPRGLWNYLMDFRTVKGTVKVRLVCPSNWNLYYRHAGVYPQCSERWCFMGLGCGGITAEGEKRKIKTKENGLREEEMWWKRKKSSEIVKTQGQISKDFCSLFQMYSCMCYLSNLCPSLEARFTCHPDHTHTVSVNTPFVWSVKRYSILYAYVFEGGSCKWQKYMCVLFTLYSCGFTELRAISRWLCNKRKSANLQRPMKVKVLMGIRKCSWLSFLFRSQWQQTKGEHITKKNVQGSSTELVQKTTASQAEKESNKWKHCLTVL